MCLIIASTGPKPSESVLRDGARKNPDGNGYAWLHRGQVQWRKGISIDEVVKMVSRATGPFVVHFRVGTHGPKSPELTHPFPITSDSRPALSGRTTRVLFHNGVYHQWESELKNTLISHGAKCPPPPWSDSRGLAVMIYYLGIDFLRLCGGSRYAVFDASRPDGKQIVMYGDWSEGADKCWYSNRNSSAFPSGYYGSASQGGEASTNFPHRRDAATNESATGTVCPRPSGTTSSCETPGTERGPSGLQAMALAALDARLVWEGFDADGLQTTLGLAAVD